MTHSAMCGEKKGKAKKMKPLYPPSFSVPCLSTVCTEKIALKSGNINDTLTEKLTLEMAQTDYAWLILVKLQYTKTTKPWACFKSH